MIRNILTVLRGTVLAQAIGFLALPFLARLFDPEAFGHYQLFLSLATLALVLPTLRYEVALLRVEQGNEYRGLWHLCLILATLVGAAGLLIAVLLQLTHWPPQIDGLPFAPWLVAIAMFIGGLCQVLNLVATRERHFSTIANSKIAQSLVYVAVALAIGKLAASDLGLIYADLLGRVALAAFLGWWAVRSLPMLRGKVSWSMVRELAFRYREYPIISTPGTLVNVAGGILTPIMIYATFSAASSGQYGLLERAVGLPISLIVIAVGQVYTSEFAHQLREDRAAALVSFRKLIRIMAALALMPLVVLIAAGPTLFAFLFGEEWRLAGELSRLMAPAYASSLLSGPVHMALTVLGYQKLQTIWELSRLALVIGLWSAVPSVDLHLELAIAGYSAIIVACNLGFVLLAFLTLRHALAHQSASSGSNTA